MAKGDSEDFRALAVALIEDGDSRRDAARALDGLAPSTAIRWIHQWTTTSNVAAKSSTGHNDLCWAATRAGAVKAAIGSTLFLSAGIISPTQ
jgi:transposase